MTVKTSVTELPESRVRVEAEVPAEEVERRVQQAARRLGSQMRVPGFRKGKVPPPVVLRRLGRGAVFEEALQEGLRTWYVDAIDEAGIATVGGPEFDFGDMPEPGEPLQFTIEIGVRPAATLGAYKGVEVGRRDPHVDDAALTEELSRLQERLATLDTVDRPAAAGDSVVVDYVGSIDGDPFDGGEARDQLIELGSGRLIPGFEEQVTGAAAGDTREITVTFPDDYQASELAGRDAVFSITVHEVKAKSLPALDDDFAAEASEFDTLAELREDVSSKLREADERTVEREFEEAVLQSVSDAATVELPDALVHARAHELVEQTMNALARQGIDKDTYLKIAGKDEHSLSEEAEPDARQALRREAVLAAVIAAEAVSPSDDDVREAVAPAADRDGVDVDELVGQLREAGRLEGLREDLANRQALELLVREAKPISVDQAKARDALWTPEKGDPAGAPSGAPDASGASSGQIWTPGS